MKTLNVKITRQDLGQSVIRELKAYEVHEAYESKLMNVNNELFVITDVQITGIDVYAIEFMVIPYSKTKK